MKNKKTTKRALFMSALSLLLCVSMLVGTTYAWFTDEVVSGMNTIAAGNLDVELLADGTPVDANTKLFADATLWEPGVVVYENLQVVNAGTLALKYQMTLNFGNENHLNGNKLSDILKVAVLDTAIADGADRAEILAKAKAATNVGTLQNFYVSGELDANTSAPEQAIVIFWEPHANEIDNLYNANNGQKTSDEKPLRIEFGVKLNAYQKMKEEDSFGDDYDKLAAVFTVAEANALMAEGEDVYLVGANEPGESLKIPAGYTGTLVLENVRVATIEETTATTYSLRAATPAKIVIRGNVVVDATAKSTDSSAISATALDISGNGTLTAIANGKAAFGIGGMTTESISISGITIKEVKGGFPQRDFINDTKYGKSEPEGGAAIGSALNGAVINLNGVTIINAVGGSKAAAIGARYHTGVTINITGSTIKNIVGGNASAAIGGSRVSNGATEDGITINIKNSTVENAQGGQFGAGIGSGYDTYCQSKQPLCTINIEDSDITAFGGKYAAGIGTGYHNAALAGEIKNSTVKAVSGEKFYKNTYTAAMDVGFGVTDPAREGTQTDSKLIYNGVEISLASAPNAVDPSEGLSGALQDNANISLTAGEFKLTSMSGLENVTIEGASDGSTKIAGVNSFNFGKDTTIKNVTFTTNGSNSVRYATTSGDVVYENCVFEGKQYGYHVDNANGGTITFNNCTFYGRNALASTGTYTFNNCTFKYTYSNYNTTNIYSKATFNSCVWDSKLELFIDSGAKAIVDGEEITERVWFISDARALEAFQREVNFKNNTYDGKIVMLSADIDMKDAYYATWTPIGQTGATQFMGTFDGHGYTIKNLNINTSKQTGAHYSTGLFGWLNSATVKNLTIENATVVGNHNVGVIAGYMETSGCTISNCHVVNATVTAKHANDDACGDKVGVIVGHAGNAGVKVENCSAKDSTVNAGRDAGQIAGAALTANVTGCTATNVKVSATGECTGANVNESVIGRVLG